MSAPDHDFAESDHDRFTDWLRARAEPDWSAATTHRFTRELSDGSLPADVYATHPF